MKDWLTANATPVQVISAAVQALFAVVLTCVGIGQWWINHKQRRVMEDTLEIAVAGLGRPYIFAEFLHQNFESWRSGKHRLQFAFSLINYGNSPAIIQGIYPRVILSRGPGYAEQEDDPSQIQQFPSKEDFLNTIAYNTHVFSEIEATEDKSFVAEAEDRKLTEWNATQELVILPERRSRTFKAELPHRPLARENQRDAMLRQYLDQIYELTSPSYSAHARDSLADVA